jgi:hypothetical protein
MPFVTDPDNLDRNQVIYNTQQKLAYVKGVDPSAKESDTDGILDADLPGGGLYNFDSALAAFQANGVVAGDILCIATGSTNAGHWRVDSVPSETRIVVEKLDAGDLQTPTDESGITYSVRAATGGTVEAAGATLYADAGVTLQALYSFTKEEWKDDTALIPIQFPFELVTREQGEVGGGADNSDWDFGNDTTIELVRAGGWADKNTGGTTQREFSGIVTLGSLDDDAQVYYLQQDGGTPADFFRTGPVNQPLLVFTDGGNNFRGFLKLFARKKGKSYSDAELADIGVTTLETLVNRFPLSHADDPAIVETDGRLAGAGVAATDIFQEMATVDASNTDGVSTDPDTTDGLFTFTSALSTFQADGLQPRDTLEITSGQVGDRGVYEIQAVVDENELTLFLEPGQTLVGDTGLSFTTRTRIRSAQQTDGALADVDGATGTLTSALSDFVTAGVAAGDIVQIAAGAAAHIGVYKVISRDSANQLTLDTSDEAFTAQSGQTFTVYRPGMHLQRKATALPTLTDTEYGTLAFTAPDQIVRTTGSWISDGYNVAGETIIITGAADPANNGRFTIESATATDLTIVEQTLVTEGASATETVTGVIPFVRGISGVVYGFQWRMFSNGGTLSQIFQWLQRQLRRATDIDASDSTSRGDITDLLMTFASPTGQFLNLHPDDVDTGELNNFTLINDSADSVNFAFTVGVSIVLNQNILDDPAANRIVVFFTTNPAGDYGAPAAVIVDDADAVDMNFANQASSPIQTTFDYDGNAQGGRTPGTDAGITVVALGLDSAQFVLATATLTRVNQVTVSLVSALERNYSNP